MPTIVEQTRQETTKTSAPTDESSFRRRLSPKAL